MPVYIVQGTTSIVAPNKATATALAADPNTIWITQSVREVGDDDLVTTDDHHAYHRAVEARRLAADERDAVWVGDAA